MVMLNFTTTNTNLKIGSRKEFMPNERQILMMKWMEQPIRNEYIQTDRYRQINRYTCIYIYICICVGEVNGTPLQYSCLENPMDKGAWQAAVHGVAKSQTRLSDFTFTFHFYALEKEMATLSSVLAWRIPGTGEPGGLPSMGSHRVRHD